MSITTADIDAMPALQPTLTVGIGDIDSVFGKRGIIVIAPHPDDDILGCGALMAAMNVLSRPVSAVYLTDGGASGFNLSSEARERLVQLRQKEARRGLAMLDLPSETAIFIGAPDGRLDESAEYLNKARDIILTLITSGDFSSVLVTSHMDDHVDHKAAYLFANQTLANLPDIRLFAYPVSSRIDAGGFQNPSLKFPILFDTDGFSAQKRAALECHKSQIIADPYVPGFTLSTHQIALMCQGPEYFISGETTHDQ